MSVEHKIKEIILGILDIPVSELTDDAYLNDDLGADPYDLEAIAATLNEEFDIDIMEDDLDVLETVSDIIALVLEKME